MLMLNLIFWGAAKAGAQTSGSAGNSAGNSAGSEAYNNFLDGISNGVFDLSSQATQDPTALGGAGDALVAPAATSETDELIRQIQQLQAQPPSGQSLPSSTNTNTSAAPPAPSQSAQAGIQTGSRSINASVTKKLAVALVGRGWVFDAVASGITGGSNVVLQYMQESEGATAFIFTRDAPGSNTLVFSRNDTATSDTFTYTIRVTWGTGAAGGSAASGILMQDARAVAMEIERETPNEQVSADISSSVSARAGTARTAAVNSSVNSAATSASAAPSAKTAAAANTSAANTSAANQQAAATSPTTSAAAQSSQQTLGQSAPTPYEAFLASVKDAYKNQKYAEAASLIDAESKKWAEDPAMAESVPQLFFDVAQYLEKAHEIGGNRNPQTIRSSMALYERIVNEYPLSVLYDSAAARARFLQQKYVYIR